jgi:hypothetical protein
MATAIAWVRVPAGSWTKIFGGPSLHLTGFEVIEFRASNASDAAYYLTYTLHRYAALGAPFYSISGAAKAVAHGTFPPSGGSTQFLPSFSSSPYTEFWLLTDAGCQSHILV